MAGYAAGGGGCGGNAWLEQANRQEFEQGLVAADEPNAARAAAVQRAAQFSVALALTRAVSTSTPLLAPWSSAPQHVCCSAAAMSACYVAAAVRALAATRGAEPSLSTYADSARPTVRCWLPVGVMGAPLTLLLAGLARAHMETALAPSQGAPEGSQQMMYTHVRRLLKRCGVVCDVAVNASPAPTLNL
jgi:hypothetical protein